MALPAQRAAARFSTGRAVGFHLELKASVADLTVPVLSSSTRYTGKLHRWGSHTQPHRTNAQRQFSTSITRRDERPRKGSRATPREEREPFVPDENDTPAQTTQKFGAYIDSLEGADKEPLSHSEEVEGIESIDEILELADEPLPNEPRAAKGFFAEDEGAEDVDEDPEFEPDDIATPAHHELQRLQELRELARVTVWDMPLLWQHRKPFEVPTEKTPIRFRYTTYMGETHPGSKKVVMDFHIPSLPNLTQVQRDKMIKILGARYDPSTQRAKMSSDRYPISAQNKRALANLLDRILDECRHGKDTFEDVPFDFRYHKPKKAVRFPEEWKMTKQRAQTLFDNRKKTLQLAEGSFGKERKSGSLADNMGSAADAESLEEETVTIPARGSPRTTP